MHKLCETTQRRRDYVLKRAASTRLKQNCKDCKWIACCFVREMVACGLERVIAIRLPRIADPEDLVKWATTGLSYNMLAFIEQLKLGMSVREDRASNTAVICRLAQENARPPEEMGQPHESRSLETRLREGLRLLKAGRSYSFQEHVYNDHGRGFPRIEPSNVPWD